MNLLLQSSRPANIFVTGQSVSFTLSHDQSTTQTISVRLSNELGTTISTRSFNVPAAQAVVVRFLQSPGYYEATAQGTGANTQATTTVILAVIDPLPAGVDGAESPFGVITHFQQNMNTNVLPLLAVAGIRHVRDEQTWQTVEATSGTYTYNGYVPYMAALAAANIDPLLIADFANPNYDGGNTPYTTAGVAGYANYAADLAQRWQAQVSTVEIWNEYNGTCCQGTATSNRPGYYTAMLAAAYQAIKTQSPATTVLGGATVLLPVPYFQQLFAQGLYEIADGYCVHPYYSPAEAVTRYFEDFRTAEASYSGGGGPKPLWVTECGMDQGDDGTNARRELGIYLVKFLTTLLSVGVKRSYWYLARDWGSYNTGLLHDQFFSGGSYAPTVAYVAFAALNKYLSGATYVGRDATLDQRTYSHHFRLVDGSDFRVLYSTRFGPSSVTIQSSQGLQVLSYMGGVAGTRFASAKVSQLAASSADTDNTAGLSTINSATPGAMQSSSGITTALKLTDEPVYLLGPITAIRENYTDRLLADSLLDFSSTTQGANGWSYGWRTEVDPTFHVGTSSQDNYDYFWIGPFYYLQVQAGSAQGSGGQTAQGNRYQVWATRRYLPSGTVTARLVGNAGRGSIGQGDGAGLNILLNGQTIFSRSLGTTAETCDANFDLTVTLTVGQPLDFCITPGPGYDNSYDSCSFEVQIIALA